MKDNDNKEIKSGKNEILFPLLFGIIAVIIMAVVSHFIGN